MKVGDELKPKPQDGDDDQSRTEAALRVVKAYAEELRMRLHELLKLRGPLN